MSAPPTVEIRELGGSVDEARVLGELTVEAYVPLLDLSEGHPYLAELTDVASRATVAVVLVAVDESATLLGGITYVPGPGPYAEFEGPDDAGIRMLAVAAGARGRGVGTALVQACIDRARSEGRRRLWLHTTARMVAAHRLYGRLGFRRAPEHDRALPDAHLLGYVLELEPPVAD